MGSGHLEHLLIADSNREVELRKDQGIVTAPLNGTSFLVTGFYIIICTSRKKNPFRVVTMLPVIGPRGYTRWRGQGVAASHEVE